jgi:hypothetical protein
MADITLADGREITFDLGTLTVKEYRALFDPKQSQADEDATMAKVTGLSTDELQALPLLEWKRVYRRFLTVCAQPLADPN